MIEKTLIGWSEWCALPALRIPAIKAKIDTGARTSAIHACDIEDFDKGGAPWVRFTLDPLPRTPEVRVVCEAPLIEQRYITSSNGHQEQRHVVRTLLTMGDASWEIALTLTSRETMRFRLLLGREALAHHLCIDPHARQLLGRRKRAEARKLYL